MIIFRKERLETELAALRDDWRKQMERSLKAVAEETITHLRSEAEATEKEVGARVAKMSEALMEVTARTENKIDILRDALSLQDERSRQTLLQLEAADERIQERVNDEATKLAQASGEVDLKLGGLRQYLDDQNARLQESLRQLQAADERLNEQLARLDLLARAAAEKVELRAASVLEATSRDMTQRAEEAMAAWGQQLRTIEHSTGQEIDRFTNRLKTELSNRLESTDEMLKNIEAARTAAQESLRNTQESLAKVSEQAVGAAHGRMQAFMGEFLAHAERQMEESGRAAAAKWIAQLEDKATDTTYTAYGSLFKVSDWCEKKAQREMETALEKGLSAASDNVKEKADAALRDFSAKAEAASEQISSAVEEGRARIRSSWETEGEQILSRFRSAFTEHAQATLNKASQELLNQLSSVLETVRAETLERESKLREAISQMDDQAVQAHELRLDQISRLSLQEAMNRFNQESTEDLDKLVRSAEQGLRHTCNEVFTEVGESLRQRLLELTFVRPQAKAATDSA